MIEKKLAYFNIFFILLYTGKRNSGNGAGAILVGQGMGMCEEMHNDACLLLGDFNITPKSSSRRGSGTNTPGTYAVN